MNAHSRKWDPRCRVQRDPSFWEGILHEHGLEIRNDNERPTHHWERNGEDGDSTIYVTRATRPIMR